MKGGRIWNESVRTHALIPNPLAGSMSLRVPCESRRVTPYPLPVWLEAASEPNCIR